MDVRSFVRFSPLFVGSLLAASAFVACSSDANTTPDAGTSAEPDATTGDQDAGADADAEADAAAAVTCPAAIESGLNKLTIGGTERSFYVDLPKDTSKPRALIFSWHGFGDTATNFKKAVHLDPDQDPSVPAIIVTPNDTGLMPPDGLAWDIAKATAADTNVDVAFFDAMLGCFKSGQTIDETRIYSFGFSAGAVVTNMLHSRYPKLFAAIVTESGVWMNDKAETDLIQLVKIDWKWPALDPADMGNVLMTHGGSKDITAFNILDLEKSAQAALPFLKTAKRTVVECAHTQGHALHPEVTPAIIAKYLFAHRLGEPSPFANLTTPDADAGSDADASPDASADAGTNDSAPTLDGYPTSCTLHLP